MDGLSVQKRRIYLSVLTLFFIITAPLVVLYASGYRLTSEFKVVKTGGIYINVPTSGAEFYLDGEYKGRGTFFQKSFFIQNLTPGTYNVRIQKGEHHSWEKTLDVFSTVISEGHALLLPLEPELIEILPFVTRDGRATSSARDQKSRVPFEQNLQYQEIVTAFKGSSEKDGGLSKRATTTIQYHGATTTVYTAGDIGLWFDSKGLHAWWLAEIEDAPYVFCKISNCARELLVWDTPISHFDFLPGNNLFVLLEEENGIVVTELDPRGPKNTQPVYGERGVFRVIDGTIYILDDGTLYKVEL